MDIVRFKGGLGNQMFQYALLKVLMLRGRKVVGSLGFYAKNPHKMPFCLKNVFENVSFEEVDEKVFNEINERWKKIKENRKTLEDFLSNYPERFFWVDEPEGTYHEHIFDTNDCTFVGDWQTEKYFVHIRNELLSDFSFSKGEEMLDSLRRKVRAEKNYVSIHIRRGDYLELTELYGNICTEQYYMNAMQYINSKINNPIFIFFSDDIKWVKAHYRFSNAIYVESKMFKNYQAWYDMCLMSCCTHNIIANSSFSWWGAWLNQKEEKKIVIAPKHWLNGYDMPDICPDNWIRLE